MINTHTFICILLLLFVITIKASRNVKLNYNRTLSIVQFYNSKGKHVYLKLHFNNSDILIDNSLQQNRKIYLDKLMKYQLDNENKLIKHESYKKTTQKADQIHNIIGSIGLLQRTNFFNLIKKTLKVNHVKLQFLFQQNVINIIQQECIYPIFPPYSVTFSLSTTNTYDITSLSTIFNPDNQSFLKIINQKKSPFQATKEQMSQNITISLKNKIISLPIKQLLQCGKYSNTNTYQCQIPLLPSKNLKKQDIGKILLYFNPVLCNKGIQLEKQIIDDGFWFKILHIVLMILLFGLLLCLINENKIINLMNKFQGYKSN